jgi:hypothetical protein
VETPVDRIANKPGWIEPSAVMPVKGSANPFFSACLDIWVKRSRRLPVACALS